MDKQIEEMARISCTIYDRKNKDAPCAGKMVCDFNCTGYEVCKLLFNNDYRRASDVAREVIGKIQSKIQIMVSSIKAQEEIGNISEVNGGAKTALEIVFKDLADLKKKYESEANK